MVLGTVNKIEIYNLVNCQFKPNNDEHKYCHNNDVCKHDCVAIVLNLIDVLPQHILFFCWIVA
jgi:hypothetical protein